MHNRLAVTVIDRPATHRVRHVWRELSAALMVPLLMSAGTAWGATIDFEQFAPAPNTCNPAAATVGIARFADGQLATGVPEAFDQTTVYWSSTACGGSNRIVIEFGVPVSNVHFLLENLDGSQPTTTYLVRSRSANNIFHTDLVALPAPAPCTSVRCLPRSSTRVTLPYTGIHGIIIEPLYQLESNFLIDDMTFAFPLRLLDTWTRLCVLDSNPACPALQAILLRLGVPLQPPTATPTETAIPTATETATVTPSGCGSSGEPCCPPAVGPPCLVGACDPASNTCP